MIPVQNSNEGDGWMQLDYLPEDREPDPDEAGPYDRTESVVQFESLRAGSEYIKAKGSLSPLMSRPK